MTHLETFIYQTGLSSTLRKGKYYRFRIHFYRRGRVVYVPYKVNGLPTVIQNKYGEL